MIDTIIGVVLFMIATMILVAWGTIRDKKAPYMLQQKLGMKAKKRIIALLKRNGKMDKESITKGIKNLSVSQFGSRKRLAVTDPKTFVKVILEDMINKEQIKVDYSKKRKEYYL